MIVDEGIKTRFTSAANKKLLCSRLLAEYNRLGVKPFDKDFFESTVNCFIAKYIRKDVAKYIPRNKPVDGWDVLKIINYMFLVEEIIYVQDGVPVVPIDYEVKDTIFIDDSHAGETTDEKLVRWRTRRSKIQPLDSDSFSPPVIVRKGIAPSIRFGNSDRYGIDYAKTKFAEKVDSNSLNRGQSEIRLGNTFWRIDDVSSMAAAIYDYRRRILSTVSELRDNTIVNVYKNGGKLFKKYIDYN